ncbi:uncharacterized protein LOC133806844 [Humulus lupulus]|uniref:uncharacterized protein LOC133806844 n=1 Tax=Humulus lupulus TaxID=3486 RepID=UPI002B41010A|nr:uncharacterized protein LOC133806844 [Humulus lupulus]
MAAGGARRRRMAPAFSAVMFQRSSIHGGARLQHSRRRRSRLQQALRRCRVSAPAVQVLGSGGAGCSRFQPWVEGQLMQMTMMVTPNINKELHYLNKEDRLLRWLVVKHRDAKYGLEFLSEEDSRNELSKFHRSSLYDNQDVDEDDDNDDEYAVDEEEGKQT